MRRSPRSLLRLAAVPALVLGSASATTSTTGPPRPAGTSVRPLTTPVLSVRRDPAWVDDTIAAQRLSKSVAAAVGGGLGTPKGPAGCVVVARGATSLYALDPTAELIPASNLKILTATAVLDTLGPGYRFVTKVAAPAPSRSGTVTGDLYLVGGGDPYLYTGAYNAGLRYPDPGYTSLDRLAAAVRAAGIRTVTGSVVGDASRYDTRIGVPTWAPQYLAEGDVGPLSALEVDDGSAPVPAAVPGGKTGPGAAVPPAPGSRTAADPALYAAQTFTNLLKAAGVSVARPAATGRAPFGVVTVTQAESAPVSAEVEQMLRVSDDTAAELFTKELGYHISGQGTTDAGVAVVRRDVASRGLPAGQLIDLDGSGLDRADRASCALLAQALEQAGTAGPLAAGLPVAARTGTLTDRMAGTAAAGRLHAKTGTLDWVSALSGFIDPAAGAPTPELASPLYFSVIINGMDSGLAALFADRIAVAFAGYPQAVPLRLLEPGS